MSPWEENLTKKHFEKMDKYDQLVIDLRDRQRHGLKWMVVLLCVKVGERGAINERANLLASANVKKRRLT